MKLRTRTAVCASFVFALSSCVESSKGAPTKALAAYILDAPPADIPHTVDLAFDGKIRMLGYRLEPDGPSAPGKDVKLTLYWQVDQPVGAGWMLFTHLLDGKGVRYASGNVDNAGPLRDMASGKPALPPGDWQRGKVYVDEQTFRIPDDARDEVVVTTGIWKDGDRLKVTAGPGDAEQRGVVAKIKIGASSAAARPMPPGRDVPQLRVIKLADDVAPPVIDGKLDDAAWARASSTGAFVDVSRGGPNTSFPVNAKARVLWDDKALYLGFDVEDTKLIGGFSPGAIDPHLWEKEEVEIMVDPDGDGDNKDYYEIQIGTQNLVFDSQFDDYNLPRGGKDGPFGHQEWSIAGKTAVTVFGTLDKDDDTDKGYVVEAAIPWSSFAKAKRIPPQSGDSWRVNFYAMKTNSGVAWSPILGEGNFHKASRFGRLIFVTAAPSASASASSSASASAISPAPSSSRK